MPAIVINDRQLLVWVLLDQPDMTRREMARLIDRANTTVENWADGTNLPDDVSAGALAALARGRYKIRVGEELAELARQHRARYMKETMALRRSKPEIAATERAAQGKYREGNAERRRAYQQQYDATNRDRRNQMRRIRRSIDRTHPEGR